MKSSKTHFRKISAMAFIFAIVFFVDVATNEASNRTQKLKTEEILARHLASIGTAEARDAVSSVTISGVAKAVVRGRSVGETSGLVVIPWSVNDVSGQATGLSLLGLEEYLSRETGNSRRLNIVVGGRTVWSDYRRVDQVNVSILEENTSQVFDLLDGQARSSRLTCRPTMVLLPSPSWKLVLLKTLNASARS